MTDDDPIYTLEEAADQLKVSTRVLSRLAQEHKISHLRPGRAYRFTASDISDYKTRNKVHAADPNPYGLTDRSLGRNRRTAFERP